MLRPSVRERVSLRVLNGWPHRKARVPSARSAAAEAPGSPVVPTHARQSVSLALSGVRDARPSSAAASQTSRLILRQLRAATARGRSSSQPAAATSTAAHGSVPPLSTFRPRMAFSDLQKAAVPSIAPALADSLTPRLPQPGLVMARISSGMASCRITNADFNVLRSSRRCRHTSILRTADSRRFANQVG